MRIWVILDRAANGVSLASSISTDSCSAVATTASATCCESNGGVGFQLFQKVVQKGTIRTQHRRNTLKHFGKLVVTPQSTYFAFLWLVISVLSSPLCSCRRLPSLSSLCHHCFLSSLESSPVDHCFPFSSPPLALPRFSSRPLSTWHIPLWLAFPSPWSCRLLITVSFDVYHSWFTYISETYSAFTR